MNSAKQKLVVVLGMHRSGTSAITRSLQVLSVSLGDRLLAPAPDNVKGFWEDRDILFFNEGLLASIKHTWCSVTPPTPAQVAVWRQEGLADKAADLLRGKMAGVTCFGIKDPRLALLLPFWQPIFADLDLDVRYVFAVRNPASVARSLLQRNGISLDHGHLLWLGHVMSGFTNTLAPGGLVVSYERLMQAPEAELQRMASFLDLEIDVAALNLYRDEFLDPSLQHHHDTGEEMPPSGFPYSLIARVHAILANLAQAPAAVHSPEIAACTTIWLEACAQMGPVLSAVDTLAVRLLGAERLIRQADNKLKAAVAAARKEAASQPPPQPQPQPPPPPQPPRTATEAGSAQAQNALIAARLASTQIQLAASETARQELEDRVALLLRLRPFWRRAGSHILNRFRRLPNA